MPIDFSKRIIKGELVFPDFTEGSLLSVGASGKVTPVIPAIAPTLESATFAQTIPSSLWQFNHSFGRIPFVVTVYDSANLNITDAVIVDATATTIEIRTDNSPISGTVTAYSFVTS